MDKRKKILIAAGVGLGAVLLLMAGGSEKTANASPAEPDQDEDDEPIAGEVPDGEDAHTIDDVVQEAGDILDTLPIPRQPPPVVVHPEPVSPPPFVPDLPHESGPSIPAPKPKAPKVPKAPVTLPPFIPELPPLPVDLPDIAHDLPGIIHDLPIEHGPDILEPPPIVLPPPGASTPAPAPDDNLDPTTLNMLRYLLDREHDGDWKELDIPVVRQWQKAEGLVVDGRFGPKGALHLAELTGLLPIVRAWPKGTYPEKALPDFRAQLGNLAAVAEEPRRAHLLAAMEREKGQAFGTPPKPVTVYIDGV